MSLATYRKYSLTPSYIRQQSSLTSHTLVVIMHSLWSSDIVSMFENYISAAHVHSCSCSLPRCLWMVSPHKRSCDWSLSEERSHWVRCQRPRTHTHTHIFYASTLLLLHSQELFVIGILGCAPIPRLLPYLVCRLNRRRALTRYTRILSESCIYTSLQSFSHSSFRKIWGNVPCHNVGIHIRNAEYGVQVLKGLNVWVWAQCSVFIAYPGLQR